MNYKTHPLIQKHRRESAMALKRIKWIIAESNKPALADNTIKTAIGLIVFMFLIAGCLIAGCNNHSNQTPKIAMKGNL